jgi:hypothetical protein
MSKSRRVSAWNACVSGAAPDAANPRAENPPDGRATAFKDAPRAKGGRPGSTAIGPPRPTRLDTDRHRRSKVPSFPSDPSPKHELAETAGPLARADKRLGVHSGRSVRRDERASHMDARGVRFTHAPEKCRRREGDIIRNLRKEGGAAVPKTTSISSEIDSQELKTLRATDD